MFKYRQYCKDTELTVFEHKVSSIGLRILASDETLFTSEKSTKSTFFRNNNFFFLLLHRNR